MIHFNIDSGGEYLLGFAKQKLIELKKLRAGLGVDLLQKWFSLASGDRVHVKSHLDNDFIRIVSGGNSTMFLMINPGSLRKLNPANPSGALLPVFNPSPGNYGFVLPKDIHLSQDKYNSTYAIDPDFHAQFPTLSLDNYLPQFPTNPTYPQEYQRFLYMKGLDDGTLISVPPGASALNIIWISGVNKKSSSNGYTFKLTTITFSSSTPAEYTESRSITSSSSGIPPNNTDTFLTTYEGFINGVSQGVLNGSAISVATSPPTGDRIFTVSNYVGIRTDFNGGVGGGVNTPGGFVLWNGSGTQPNGPGINSSTIPAYSAYLNTSNDTKIANGGKVSVSATGNVSVAGGTSALSGPFGFIPWYRIFARSTKKGEPVVDSPIINIDTGSQFANDTAQSIVTVGSALTCNVGDLVCLVGTSTLKNTTGIPGFIITLVSALTTIQATCSDGTVLFSDSFVPDNLGFGFAITRDCYPMAFKVLADKKYMVLYAKAGTNFTGADYFFRSHDGTITVGHSDTTGGQPGALPECQYDLSVNGVPAVSTLVLHDASLGEPGGSYYWLVKVGNGPTSRVFISNDPSSGIFNLNFSLTVGAFTPDGKFFVAEASPFGGASLTSFRIFDGVTGQLIFTGNSNAPPNTKYYFITGAGPTYKVVAIHDLGVAEVNFIVDTVNGIIGLLTKGVLTVQPNVTPMTSLPGNIVAPYSGHFQTSPLYTRAIDDTRRPQL